MQQVWVGTLRVETGKEKEDKVASKMLEEVLGHIHEMYAEVAAGRMGIPDLRIELPNEQCDSAYHDCIV